MYLIGLDLGQGIWSKVIKWSPLGGKCNEFRLASHTPCATGAFKSPDNRLQLANQIAVRAMRVLISLWHALEQG